MIEFAWVSQAKVLGHDCGLEVILHCACVPCVRLPFVPGPRTPCERNERKISKLTKIEANVESKEPGVAKKPLRVRHDTTSHLPTFNQ